MKYCEKCGAIIDSSYKFCIKCGNKINPERDIVDYKDNRIKQTEDLYSEEKSNSLLINKNESKTWKIPLIIIVIIIFMFGTIIVLKGYEDNGYSFDGLIDHMLIPNANLYGIYFNYCSSDYADVELGRTDKLIIYTNVDGEISNEAFSAILNINEKFGISEDLDELYRDINDNYITNSGYKEYPKKGISVSWGTDNYGFYVMYESLKINYDYNDN